MGPPPGQPDRDPSDRGRLRRLNELAAVFPTSALAHTIGLAAFHLDVPILAHAVLSYQTGRLASRLDRVFVATCYGFWLAFALPLLLFIIFVLPTTPASGSGPAGRCP